MERGTARTIAWIVAILVLCAAAFYVFERHIERHQARQVRVFEMGREYRDVFSPVRTRFSHNWNEFRNETIDPYNGGALDENTYAVLVRRFLDQDSNDDDFESLLSMYATVGACVQDHLCDFWTARSLFGDDVMTFYHNMYPALEYRRQLPAGREFFDFVAHLRAADRGEISESGEYRLLDWD